MYFESVDALISMDGHGVFVWAAYAVTLSVIVMLLVFPVRRRRRFLRQLSGELKRSGQVSPPGGQ